MSVRTPTTGPRLTIQGTPQAPVVQGTAAPNTVVEVANLTSAGASGLALKDAYVQVKTDAQGRFSLALPGLQAGDVVRLKAGPTASSQVTVRADALGADARNAQLAVDNLALKDAGGGKVMVSARDAARPLAEPGTYLEIRNTRSGNSELVQLDDHGMLPADVKLDGVPGDTFAFLVSDGVHNDHLVDEAGRITLEGQRPVRDLPDPAHHPKYGGVGGGAPAKLRHTGPLFKEGARPADVLQGYLGNCYVCAAAASLAAMNPELLQKAIKDNGDNTFTVTFKEMDARGMWRDKQVTVDGELYSNNGRSPLYGKGTGGGAAEMELWFPIFEKAWAQHKGSYETIGGGGTAHHVFTAVTGRVGKLNDVEKFPDAAWQAIRSAVDKGLPVAATTFGTEQAALYTNSGLHANHAYSVLGYAEKDGVKTVTLRNPWGRSEYGSDGADDGTFSIPLQELQKYFAHVHSVR